MSKKHRKKKLWREKDDSWGEAISPNHLRIFKDLTESLGIPSGIFRGDHYSTIDELDEFQKAIRERERLREERDRIRREEMRIAWARGTYSVYIRGMLQHDVTYIPEVGGMDIREQRDRAFDIIRQLQLAGEEPRAEYQLVRWSYYAEVITNFMSGASLKCCPVCGETYKEGECSTNFQTNANQYRDLWKADEVCSNCGMYEYHFDAMDTTTSYRQERIGVADVECPQDSTDRYAKMDKDRQAFLIEARAMYKDPEAMAFLRKIRGDFGARLVFADWLEETGKYPLQLKAIRDLQAKKVAESKPTASQPEEKR